MARMQGIPARIVNGYLGGDFNPHGGFWEVRQKEAHAWVEVYYDNKWHRIDPTAVVSDIRISQGMDSLIAPTRSFVEKALNLSLLISLQQRLQAIGHFWDQNVVGYDGATRISLIQHIGELWEKWQLWFYVILIVITVTIVLLKPQWLAWLFSRIYRPIPVHQQLMNRFDKLLFHRLSQHRLKSHSPTLDEIHKLSINERKQLIQGGSNAHRQQSLRFLTEYQQWRFNPGINGTTNGAGRRAVIRLKNALQHLSKING